jgi:hypothetical protein
MVNQYVRGKIYELIPTAVVCGLLGFSPQWISLNTVAKTDNMGFFVIVSFFFFLCFHGGDNLLCAYYGVPLPHVLTSRISILHATNKCIDIATPNAC